jgi:hypothetical protein
LDVKIQYHYPEPTPLANVFHEMSQQSGVALELDATLKVRTLSSLPQTVTLRKYMEIVSAYKAKWIKEGDGYKLVPDPENTGLPKKE